MLDIAATVENRKTRLEWGKERLIGDQHPVDGRGGISTLEDIELVLESGC